MISLRNKSKRLQTFTLTSECVGQGLRMSKANHPRVHTNAKGAIGMRMKAITFAPTLTLLAGETREGLPDAILRVPAIARAIRRRDLIVVRPATTKPEPKPKKKRSRSRSRG